jgi:hypothetical protein
MPMVSMSQRKAKNKIKMTKSKSTPDFPTGERQKEATPWHAWRLRIK